MVVSADLVSLYKLRHTRGARQAPKELTFYEIKHYLASELTEAVPLRALHPCILAFAQPRTFV